MNNAPGRPGAGNGGPSAPTLPEVGLVGPTCPGGRHVGLPCRHTGFPAGRPTDLVLSGLLGR